MTNRVITCNCHGCTATTTDPMRDGWIQYQVANRGGRMAYVCEYHAHNVEAYSADNTVTRGVSIDGFTYGIEFEVDRDTYELRGHLEQFGFMPSYDCTVDCEYKSPIFNNLKWHKLLNTAETIMANGGGEVSERCGTHMHVGHGTFINEYTNQLMAIEYHDLFDELSRVMFHNPAAARALFGRELLRGTYAAPIHDNDSYAYDHCNFINLQHNDTIEFRICKFVNAKQYKRAMAFCKTATECIITNYIKYADDASKREHKARLTGNKLAKLFNKHAAEAMELGIKEGWFDYFNN